MKNQYLFSLSFILLLFACTSDDNPVTNNDTTVLTLHYTEKFIPTLDAYNSALAGSFKNVKYYQNDLIVSDITYDVQGSIYSVTEHTYDGLTYIQEYTGINVTPIKTTYTYDTFGRIVEKKKLLLNSGMLNNPTSITKYIYNADATITRQAVDPDTGLVIIPHTFNYLVNSEGLINEIQFGSAHSTIVFQNDKPIKYFHDNGINEISGVDFIYYSTPIPLNMQLTVAQINNSLFEDFETRIADNCNYYLKSYVGLVEFEKTFNNQNYIIYNKAIGTMNEEVYDSETFYYYN